MKIKTLKIVGVKELVEAVCGEDGDSFGTHIEDPETLETAEHAFVVGDNDYEKVVNAVKSYDDVKDVLDIRGMITVYARLEHARVIDLWNLLMQIGYTCVPTIAIGKEWSSMLRINYFELWTVKKSILENVWHTHVYKDGIREFLEWIDSLPYQELLEVETDDEEDD